MTQNEALTIMQSGANVFLTGEPGAGKTYTVNLFRDWLMNKNIKCTVTASTGIAATHINGTTIHSFSGIGIKKGITEEQVKKILDNFYKVKDLCETRVLIVDEVSMLDAQFITDLDYILKIARGDSSPFGGVQMVFVGDFFQLPPVTRKDENGEVPETMFAFESEAWTDANLKVCYLTEQHRTDDALFIDILARIRNGTVTEEDLATLRSSSTSDPSLILFTHNIDVDKINKKELLKLPGPSYENCTYSEGIRFLKQRLIQDMLSPFKLELRVGAKVMFTKNNFGSQYVNGTLGTVVGYVGRNPKVQINDGDIVEVKKAEWVFEDKDGTIKARAVQYPLRLAYAITVHKSQGMSIDSARIDLTKVFEYGQGYVAISRVRSLKGLHLTGINDAAFAMSPKVMRYDTLIRNSI